jgi:hypothetical protein
MKTKTAKSIKLVTLSPLVYRYKALSNRVSNRERRFEADFEEKAES